MNNIYAMQRANGDWFAFDDRGCFLVPVFHNIGDAMIARTRNFEMLLFKPVALDTRLLKQIVPANGGGDVDFRMVNNPVAKLNRGSLVELTHLASLVAA
jgi:hypothetical protein